MSDQADKLRQLVVETAPRVRDDLALAPTIVLAGGKGGVGTTTVAVNLAAALAQSGRRTVLVDAAAHADAAQALGIDVEPGMTIEHVLSGAVSAIDAIHAGPAGISLLPGHWAADASPDRSTRSLERLLEQLQSLAPHADAVVIDSGRGVTNWTPPLWYEAALVLLVTTPDDVSVMDTYATIKRGLGAANENAHEANLHVLVNACYDTSTAIDVQSRLAAACRRFLGRTIGRAPQLPRHIGELGAGGVPPLAWEDPAAPFARSVHQLGRFAGDVLAQQKRSQRHEYEICTC